MSSGSFSKSGYSLQLAASSLVGALSPALLAWFERAGRKHLPWQRDPTPYRVWVSEIMLQQTQVATVIPYYERFMQRFPDVQTLAAARLDEVLHLWTGLGYYARARNLHRAAQRVVGEFKGVFPEDLTTMQSLPGVGRSTAGAILALARGQRHPILDGNVKRVLARYFGVDGDPGERNVLAILWSLAEQCTPPARASEYTQAIMDLGATVCVRTRPHCAVCPLHAHCIARIEHRQAQLPAPRKKRPRPQRSAHALILMRADGAILLERRPPTGLWGGLWTLPQFDDAATAQAWTEQWRVGRTHALPPLVHAFTHFELLLHPLLMELTDEPPPPHADACWYASRENVAIGLAAPTMRLIAVANEMLHGTALRA